MQIGLTARQGLEDWWFHIRLWINWNNWRARQTVQPRVQGCENKASKHVAVKICGSDGGGRNSQPHRRVLWRDPQGLECTKAHPPRNQDQQGPLCLWVAGEVTESWPRAEQAPFFPLRPLPHIQCHNAATWVALAGRIPKTPTLNVTGMLRPKNDPNEEKIKAPEKIQ